MSALSAAYRVAGAAAASWLRARARAGTEEERARRRERLGLWQGGAPASPWIWLHAASVGEVAIAAALARALRPHAGRRSLVVTCQTATGRRRLTEIHDGPAHYFPLDHEAALKHVLVRAPALFVSIETEIWPCLLRMLAARGVPAAIANARISDAAMPRYRWIRPLVAPALSSLARVCARDAVSAQRLIELGARGGAVEITGDLKLDILSSQSREACAPLFMCDAKRPLVVAGSTHDGEDEIVMQAFRILRRQLPGVRLALAPRHPARAAAVKRAVEATDVHMRMWSQGEGQCSGWDVLVMDEIGRLPGLYACAAAAFVGGSLAPGPGGHNLLEPVACGAPVVTGPHLTNVSEQRALLDRSSALRIARDPAELAAAWLDMLTHRGTYQAGVRRAQAAILEGRGAMARTVESLAALLNG
ncbi:MAG TPA: glycosyltransferase N-terminal domain-containing protein [Candidatus Limnocylindrales bacterium]|nr:glycosyltransferase N-terminal domain-containing protein [Candidatus Limnocylindrales bacterium]